MKNEDVRAAIAAIPFLAGYDGPFERLGGLTNTVFRLGPHVLRLPGKGTEEYINRAEEKVAAEKAARAGVSPDVLYAASESGVMVSRFIDGSTTMSADAFRALPGAPGRAGQAFHLLHTSGAVFPARFDLFGMIEDYLAVLATKDVDLPAGYHDVVAEAAKIRPILQAAAPAPVACHCDPLCENFLDTGTRMWIVDWEYAGMNYPMWDLGDLSVEGGFDPAQDDELLQAYFSGAPSAGDRGRMVIYKAMCDLLWTLWGLIQLANDNPAEDFRAYADERFARCKTLMATPDFSHHVEAVRASAA
ncbi:MAG: phosphotransferase family protein [Pseudomonadota bacterium]